MGATTVSRLPVDPGPAAWNEILPPPAPAGALDGPTTADWLIVGGGFAGLAAARRLAQLYPGDRIVLLEARRIGQGPAGRNTGFMIDLPHDLSSDDYGGAVDSDRAQTRANRAAIDFAAGMAAEFELGDEAFTRSGKTNAAATEKGDRHNRDYAAHLDRMGEAHAWLDAAQMHEMTGTGYYSSGVHTPGTAMIQPALFVRGVAAGLASNRVRIHEDSPVVRLARHGDWVAETPTGRVTAPRVILAVNGHAESFGHFRGRLLHVFTYASMTRALTGDEVRRLGGQPRWGVTPADPMGTTVRRIAGQGGDRIVVRNRFTCDPAMEVSEARIARVGRAHDRAFAARFPMLDGVEMQYRWGGRLCLSRNGVPALGEVEEGLFSACCQNGLGTAKGTLHGMLTADLASGRGSALLDEVMAQPAPKPLPPRPLTWLGANAVMRWGEFRAGREM
ncbi:NAD(P)/FAD-dependent oxidoreductase [Roseovarius salinarum]|uniref:NAD(P)/FAD-dependent oxidoreductase n=1 Tax=Roseovarius salinarum TaxID=1981892 RepID=UPI000C32BDB3|nr:FAD-binding oxidoreductase [Roseovarius salinarum]